jgi:predicted RNA-binding Zn-ribbon protein involved in translation (DUF1610 family)
VIEKTILATLRWWTRFLLVGLLGLGALASAWPPTWANHLVRAATLVFLGFVIVAMFVYGFRCPRCRHALLYRAATIVDTRGPHTCPRCGVSLGEARDPPPR